MTLKYTIWNRNLFIFFGGGGSILTTMNNAEPLLPKGFPMDLRVGWSRKKSSEIWERR